MISLQQVAKKYDNAKKQITTKQQKLRQKLYEEIQSQTIKALKIQNHKVSEIHKNQQAIEQRIRKNNQMTIQIRRSMTNWLTIYESLNKSLKNAGDLAHYASYVQEQIQEIATLLCNKQAKTVKSQEKQVQRQNQQAHKKIQVQISQTQSQMPILNYHVRKPEQEQEVNVIKQIIEAQSNVVVQKQNEPQQENNQPGVLGQTGQLKLAQQKNADNNE